MKPRSTLALILFVCCGLSNSAHAGGDQERILWRFDMESSNPGWEVSVGPDGTVYASDDIKLHAFNPDGSVKWTTTVVRDNTPIDFLADGTLITRLQNSIVALNPDGSVVWTFSYPSNGPLSEIEVGPGVGPDGNIYAVSSVNDGYGLGAFSLTPQGDLRWNNEGNPILATPSGHTGGPVYFTQDRMIFPFTISTAGGQQVKGFDLDGNQTLSDVDFTCVGIPRTDPLNRLLIASGCGIEAMDPDGNEIYWRVQFGPTNLAPAIGPDAIAYSAQYFGDVNAINPDGSIKWTSSTATWAHRMMAVEPNAGRMIYSGAEDYGIWEFVGGVDIDDGLLLWTVDMTTVGGHTELVHTRIAPTSPDGSVVYFTTRFTSLGAPGALYAVRITDGGSVGVETTPPSDPDWATLLVHPNPAPDGQISIDFELTGESMDVELAIYSVTGRRVRTLYVGGSIQAPGRVLWDGMDERGTPVTSGSYFTKLTGRNGVSETRRITVLR